MIDCKEKSNYHLVMVIFIRDTFRMGKNMDKENVRIVCVNLKDILYKIWDKDKENKYGLIKI